MARQFKLAYIRPTASGEYVKATVVDRDWSRFTEPPTDVQVVGETDNGDPIVVFPKHKLIGDSILDFDR